MKKDNLVNLLVLISLLFPLSVESRSPIPDSAEYIRFDRCRNKIDKTIQSMGLSDFSKDKFVSCTFSIDQIGKIHGLSIHRSSGSNSIDQTALAIIRESAPFPPSLKRIELVKVLAEFTSGNHTEQFFENNILPPSKKQKAQWLESWFKQCETKIKLTGTEIDTEHRGETINHYQFPKPIQVFFILNAYGKISMLTVLKSSGSEKLDDDAVSLIKKAAPFKSPPTKLPMNQGILVSFSNKTVNFELSDSQTKNSLFSSKTAKLIEKLKPLVDNSQYVVLAKFKSYYSYRKITRDNPPIAQFHKLGVLKGTPLRKKIVSVLYEFKPESNSQWKFQESIMPNKNSWWFLFIDNAKPVDNTYKTYLGAKGRVKYSYQKQKIIKAILMDNE